MQLHFFFVFVCCHVILSRGHNVHNALSHHPAAVTAAAPSPAAPADNSSSSSSSPPPSQPNLIALMSKKGCKAFADLLTAGAGDVARSFEDTIGGGLTVFCPGDDAVKAFAPKFKNLTADGKASLLLYHGVPVYYSLDSLKSSNGVMNTLATDGVAKNFNFTVQNDGEAVTIKTAGPIARIKKAIYDKDPLAIYSIDEVLEPRDLFKPAEVPSPAPAPAPEADAPEAGKGKGKKKRHVASPPAPEGPDGQPADQKAADEKNAGRRFGGKWWVSAAVTVAAAAVVVA